MNLNLSVFYFALMATNVQYMKAFGISKSKPVKPLQILLNITALKLALSAKCFIYIVVCWALFIIS